MIRGAMIIEEGESVEQLDDDDGPNLPNGLSVHSVLSLLAWLATHKIRLQSSQCHRDL